MVDNDGKIPVLNEAFKVGKEFISEYELSEVVNDLRPDIGETS